MAVEFPDRFPVPQAVDPVEPVVPRYHQMSHAVAVAKRGKAPSELCFPESVAIDPNTKHIYVAEGDLPNFARVSIFSETGEYLNSYTHEHMKSLCGIAIHGNNLYVTDWKVHAVFHIKIESDFRLVARLGSEGSDIGQFNNPLQLSISSNGDLYIADWGNDIIQILDSSLHPIREVAHPSMHRPCDVKLTTDEMYVLSESDTPCVHIFSYTGHKIRSLITRGVGMQVTHPSHFCLDAHKSLIISDLLADQIKIISNEGTLLHTLGEPGDEVGMFVYPTGLALTSNLKLVTVSWGNNYRLHIFSSL